MNRLFFIISIFILICNNIFAETGPVSPKDPSVEFAFNDPNVKTFPAEIIRKGRDKTEVNIILRTSNISFIYQKQRVQIKIDEITSIEFLEWQEKPEKEDTFIFYPSKIILTAKDEKQYTLRELPEFNRIEFNLNDRKKFYYTYFYDYWKKGKWKNSDTDDRTYPSKNPLPGTVQQIIFIEKNNNDTINYIIKTLTK